MKSYDLTYISFGAGVQSTALLICSNLGLHGVPRADVAIFADTQNEPKWVYEWVQRMVVWSNIPVHVTSKGNLLTNVVDANSGKIKRCANIPMWTTGKDGKSAPMRRQCTREYKIDPIEKHVRSLLGYPPKKRIKHRVRCMLGISTDEAQRMKPSRTKWITNEWPLIDARLRRSDCKRIVMGAGLPEPQKSACTFCPYRDDASWLDMQQNHPREFDKAVKADRALRDQTGTGLNEKAYVHRSLEPLDEVDFESRLSLPMFDGDQFGNECEGMCGV